MKTTAKEARETTVFVRDYNGAIEETNLYEHIMRSNNETTSPVGVMPIKFYEEIDGYYRHKETGEDIDLNDDSVESKDIERYSLFIVYKWYFQKKQEVARFETEEEAENYLFEWVYDYDFQTDDQRSTQWFDTFEEAEEDLAEMEGLDVDVWRSIERKRKLVEECNKSRRTIERRVKEKRLNDLANIYAKDIQLIPGENRKETQTRISKQLGRIEKDVFWRVINIVRANQGKLA